MSFVLTLGLRGVSNGFANHNKAGLAMLMNKSLSNPKLLTLDSLVDSSGGSSNSSTALAASLLPYS